jgi:hypothetical protein
MKFYITGGTRDLGKYLADHFNCECLDRPIDLNTDIDSVIDSIEQGSTVILNAHASQLEYVHRLKDKCKLVICGSVAAVNSDLSMPEYSEEKHNLEKTVTQLALHSKYPMLYLRLTSSSYRSGELIANSIRFWLDNPDTTFMGYNIK